MRVDACHPHLADQYWHVVEPLIAKACEASRGEYSPEQVRDYILDETWVLWIGSDPDADVPLPEAVAATHLEDWPGGQRVCRLCFVAAENMDDWRRAFETIHGYAVKEECAFIRTEGRTGWARVMGWKPISQMYEVAV